MKNFKNSDYALNKYNDGIVYDFADGAKELTLADFLAANPGATAEDFAKLKAISDEDYRERDRNGYNQSHKDMNIEWAEQNGKCFAKSPEEAFIDAIEALGEAERRAKRVALAKLALGRLTDVQRRRYLLHVVDGLTTREIANLENSEYPLEHTTHQAISKSLLQADKKIKKFLATA
jgi:FMN phosphatase YigB (HAD superfamily)